MGSAQKGLLALAGILLLLVLAGMLCGPDRDELASSHDSGVAVNETRRGAEGVDLGPTPRGPRDEAAAGHRLDVLVTDDVGTPLVGARAVLILERGEDRRPAASASAGEDGRAALEEVADGVYQLIVSAPGYMSSVPVAVRLPDEAGREVPVRLQRAARLEGSLFLLDGQPALRGVVRLRNTDGSGTAFHLTPDERGSFETASLRPGVWEIAWLDARDEPPDARLVVMRAVSAGERVRLEITLPDRVDAPSEGRAVGIVERPQ